MQPVANHYEDELAQLGHTYAAACTAEIESLKLAIASTAESSMIGVGSGGSFTVASLLCSLHEAYTGRVSRPSTPLEIICSPTLASSSPVFLVSAEGKNPDIVEALERARRFSSRTVHVLTNRQESTLMEHVRSLPGVKPYVFELAKKDGYLATNSLLLDAVLVARAYGELNGRREPMPADMAALLVGDQSVEAWLQSAMPFINEAVRRGALTVVYSPLLRPIATDLESKLSEGALLHTQLADLRSYAHGRHLWLAQRPQECAVLALVEPSLDKLWEGMRGKFPADIPTLTMPLAGADPVHLIAGLVAQMHLVAAVGRAMHKDPGRPDVPTYGREIHYANLRDVIPLPQLAGPAEEQSKYEVLGAHWPSLRDHGTMRRAAQAFIDAMRSQRFKAVVFDYDGTLCSSQSRDGPPSPDVVAHLVRLARAGIVVGIASGRPGDRVGDTPDATADASIAAETAIPSRRTTTPRPPTRSAPGRPRCSATGTATISCPARPSRSASARPKRQPTSSSSSRCQCRVSLPIRCRRWSSASTRSTRTPTSLPSIPAAMTIPTSRPAPPSRPASRLLSSS